jgi:hypothetical protein
MPSPSSEKTQQRRQASPSKNSHKQPPYGITGVNNQSKPSSFKQTQGLAPSSTQPSASTSTSASTSASTSTSALTSASASASASQANSSNNSPRTNYGQVTSGPLLNRKESTTGQFLKNPPPRKVIEQGTTTRGNRKRSNTGFVEPPREPGLRTIAVKEKTPEETPRPEPVVDEELEKINSQGKKNNIYGFLEYYSGDSSFLNKYSPLELAKDATYNENDIVIVNHNGNYLFGVVSKKNVDGTQTVLVYNNDRIERIDLDKTYLFGTAFLNGDTIGYKKIFVNKITNDGGPYGYSIDVKDSFNKSKYEYFTKLDNKKLKSKELISDLKYGRQQGGRKRTTRRHKIARRKTGKRR